MCGIIGIATKQKQHIAEMLEQSLLRLTYRGYDSYGIAIGVGDRLSIAKGVGRVQSLMLAADTKGRIGIGHTRWATHGAVSEGNAHPQMDCTGNIAVVHNGIVDNYSELREELKSRKHRFRSDTDTEVIPHLIEEKLEDYIAKGSANPFLLAFRDTVRELKGTYAIAALWAQDHKIYAARRTSPLIVGIGQDAHFVSSDISAFLEYTNRFVPLEDYQIAIVSADSFEVRDLELKQMVVQENIYPFDVEEISKGKYTHFMLKEIQEQDESLEELLRKQDEIKDIVERLGQNLQKIRKIYFTGCGSSFHASMAGKYIFERILRIPSEAILSSEFKTTIRDINLEDSLIILLSQSGETLDTYVVLEEISKLRNRHAVLAIVNVPYSSEERLVNHKLVGRGKTLHLHTKPEICVVATKTYTAQLYLLALLALQIGLKIFPEERKAEITKLVREARQIPSKVRKTLDSLDSKTNRLVVKYTRYSCEETREQGSREDVFIIGRGINLATAYEAALKLREVCYISALGIAGGELKHGSLAAVDRHTPVIILFPPSSDTAIWKSTLNNFMEVQARGAPIISICCTGDRDKQVRRLSADVVSILDTNWLLCPILQVVFLQLFAYRMAVKKGIDPDYPRHLAKTVTVE